MAVTLAVLFGLNKIYDGIFIVIEVALFIYKGTATTTWSRTLARPTLPYRVVEQWPSQLLGQFITNLESVVWFALKASVPHQTGEAE